MTAITTVFPIFLMIGLGLFARSKRLLTAEQASGLNTLAFKILFPVMIFDALFTSGIPDGAGVVLLVTLALRLLSMAAAWLTGKLTHSEQAYLLPYLYPTTAGGNLAYPLYASIVGAGFIQNIILLDLSGMAVSFLIIPAMLSASAGEGKGAKSLVLNIARDRMVQSMLLGAALNLLGGYGWLQTTALYEVYIGAVSTLTSPLVPLILFGIGYSFRLDKDSVKQLLASLGVRTVFMALGSAALLALLPRLAANREIRLAVLLYFVCSPMLTLPAMLTPIYKDERGESFVSAFLSLSMVVTLVWYIIIVVFIA